MFSCFPSYCNSSDVRLFHIYCVSDLVDSSCAQGSYGSWKTWKVIEFQYSKIQAWKSWKINFSHGKSWQIEILHNINKVFYLFQFTSHNNNMNCCYITDFCKSEVNFFFYYKTSRSWILKKDFQVMDFEKSGHGKSWKSHGILNGRRCTNPVCRT